MNHNENYKLSDITEKVIRAFYKVYNSLGFGFLEKVYENALFMELKEMGLFVEKQRQIKDYYKKRKLGSIMQI